MIKKWLLIACSMVYMHHYGQMHSIEFLVGHKGVFGSTYVQNHFNDSTKWGYFSITNYQGTYTNKGNELVTINQATFDVTKKWKIAAGVGFNGLLDFYPSAGFQYTLVKPQFLLVFNPGCEFNRSIAFQQFAIFQWNTNRKHPLLIKLQGLYIHNLSHQSHERSYVYLRLGKRFQKLSTGLAANLDFYGDDYSTSQNFGCYLNYQF